MNGIIHKKACLTVLLFLLWGNPEVIAADISHWQNQSGTAVMNDVRAAAEKIADYRAIIGLSPETDDGIDGALAGIPILIKDNIETRDLPTTAGSLFLQENYTGRDAPAVARLREAGAVIAGKTNLSEWANFRSERSSSGWSAIGGQTRNAFDRTRSPCGSSSGSAVVVALGVVPAALGTETNGSVTCPASINGIVGFKPTVGLISQQGVVPISQSQDTIGPMTNSVADAATLTRIMAGKALPEQLSPADPDKLKLGVIEPSGDLHPEAVALLNQAIDDLEKSGVEFVRDLSLSAYDGFSEDTYAVLLYEFKQGLNDYLAGLPDSSLNTKTLADLIQFNQDHSETELSIFDQGIFEKAQGKAGLNDPAYQAAKARAQATTRGAIDSLLQKHELSGLIAITTAPAWKIDHVLGDHYTGGFSTFPAVAGYPHLTVPMGVVDGLPVGLSVTASNNQDWEVLEIGALFEDVRTAELPQPKHGVVIQ